MSIHFSVLPKALMALCVMCVIAGCDDNSVDTSRGATIQNEWGFTMGIPKTRSVSCEGSTINSPDVDWLCTFEHDGTSGVIYVQNTPVSCEIVTGTIPIYQTGIAEMWIDGQVSTLTDAQYDYGGGHHNDYLRVTVNGNRLEYNHSSIDYRIRACHAMDCTRLLNTNDTVIIDGCDCDRTRPIICTQVNTDGTFGPIVDTFEKCEGDALCTIPEE